jgi:hypothetical protein
MTQCPSADWVDSGSELDESDVVFSPPITPGSNAPPTPASDAGDHFPNVLGSSMDDSADQKLSELDLSDTDRLRSLDTVYPSDETLEELLKAESAEMAKPTTMITSDSPDPSSYLDMFDFDELEVAPSESPPPSRTPSPTASGTFPFRS